MKLVLVQKLLLVYLAFLVAYWVLLQMSHEQTSIFNYLYSVSFSLVPLVGGLIGVSLSRSWGLLSSAIGKAVLYISLGAFFWGLGSMIFAYYNIFLNVPAPYPSLADASYILCWPLWGIGIINLSHATGVKFSLRKVKGRLFLFIVPLILIALSYYLLVIVARAGSVSDFSGGLKVFFDLAYPIGDVVIVSLAVLIYGLSFNYLGGKFKYTIIILLLGFVFNYIADFIFSYTTTTGSFFVGDFGDLIFTLALFMLTFGVLGFDKKILEEK